MEILTQTLIKIYYTLFFFSSLYIVRHIFLFVRHLNKPEPVPYELSKKELFYLGLSVSYMITTFLKGVWL